MGCPFSTETGSVKVITQCGKFTRIQEPGFGFILCPCIGYELVAGTLSLRVQQLDVHCTTKTRDNVFVEVKVTVQYQVEPGSEKDAFFKLTHPEDQIKAYVYDALRAEVPKETLDKLFLVKDDLSNAIKTTLQSAMKKFGFMILSTPGGQFIFLTFTLFLMFFTN